MKKHFFIYALFFAIPFHFSIAAEQSPIKNLDSAVFAQHCFWTGELRLGQLDGVEKTEAGCYDGREVTHVWFDKNKINRDTLISRAWQLGVANKVYYPAIGTQSSLNSAGTFNESNYRRAPESDQKKQLQDTPLENVRMTEYQRTKTNAFIRTDSRKALSFLNSEQLESLENN